MKNIKCLFAMTSLLFATSVFAEIEVHTQDKPVFTVVSNNAEFVIKLKSNPSTGYSWFLTEYNSNLVVPLRHTFEAATDKKMVGAPGYEFWTFRIKPAGFAVPQITSMKFVYKRPWEAITDQPPLAFSITTGKND